MSGIDVTRIAGNIGALNALNSLKNISSELAIHQQRLSTGKQLLSASDDPAGMSIATTFDIRRQALTTVLNTIGDAQNLMSNTEGGLTKIQDILVQMQNKALQAKGDTIGDSERSAIQAQLRSFRDAINDIVAQTQWNGKPLLNGNVTSGSAQATTGLNFLTDAAGGTSTFAFTAGTTTGAGYIGTNQSFATIASGTGAAAAGAYAGATGVTDLALSNANLDTTGTAAITNQYAYNAIANALGVVKQGIAQVGAFTASLNFKQEGLTVMQATTEAAYNRIMNADMAAEQVTASKYMILQQTATAMLAQANTSPQFLLTLFR
jgi:flagellin